jgi:hypothetical protein
LGHKLRENEVRGCYSAVKPVTRQAVDVGEGGCNGAEYEKPDLVVRLKGSQRTTALKAVAFVTGCKPLFRLKPAE